MGKRDLNLASRISELRQLERERELQRRMEKKGMTRKEAEVERAQREMPKLIIAGLGHERMVERAQEERKGLAISEFLERKKAELGPQELEKQKQKLMEEGAKLWERSREGKRRFYELEEQAQVREMKWSELEKPLRQWLKNEGEIRGWTEEIIENTVQRELRRFETSQHVVKERLKAQSFNPEEDFRKRMLNPQTRKAAIRYYLHDHVDKPHFLIETIELLFAELDKLKRRR